MTVLGYQALHLSLVLAAFATLLFFTSGKTRSMAFQQSAEKSVYAIFGLLTFASIALFYALFTRDFQIEYVAQYSNRSLSWFYTGAAFWAGQAGSLLLWAWLLSIFSVIVLAQNKKRNPDMLPYIMGTISITTFFFVYLLVFKSNPFARTGFTPPDGNGLNPLLQNPGMIFHPPSLYVGFVGYTVPFAFAIAALITKKLDVQWIKSIRRWSLFSWIFLTIGNILGMQWAYVELGWGGYWAWDPVENSSLLPWLTGTAFLHSIIVQERKAMLKTWNFSLIILTFALTIFGTFVTRSGLISSVHAFGVSTLGPLFLGFLALILIVSIYLLTKRSKLLASQRKLGSWASKESSFLLNNMFFVALTIGVFLGTIMPTITEAIRGEKITVGIEYFNRIATPIGMAVFLLIGVCTLLAWGKTSTNKLLKNFALPALVSLVGVTLLILIGITNIKALLALGIAIFAIATTLIEYFRGAWIKSRTDQCGFFTALGRLTLLNKRRYGGHIVHLGVLSMFLGIIGSSAFTIETTETINKGDRISVGAYELEYQGLRNQNLKDMRIDAALFDIYKNDKMIGTIKSEKHIHKNFQPATEVGIRSTLAEDLYVILGQYKRNTEEATISVLVIPLTLWMWIGGIVMFMGTLISIAPFPRKKT